MNGEKILVEALARTIQHEYAGKFGYLLLGLNSLPVKELAAALGGPECVYISLVGVPDAQDLTTWAHEVGWTEHSFGHGPTHAVQVRNDAPENILRVVAVYRQESRLHSLVNRGYEPIGPDEVIRTITYFGEEQALNDAQKNLWRALRNETILSRLSLDQVLEYASKIFEASLAVDVDLPRELLPLLGLLPDARILSPIRDEKEIVRRLNENYSMVDRLLSAEREDQINAAKLLKQAPAEEQAALHTAYGTFLKIRRGNMEALKQLPLDQAVKLVSGKKPERARPVVSVNTDSSEPTPSSTTGPTFESFVDAAIELAAAGHLEELTQLVDEADKHLQEPEIEETEVRTGDVRVRFDPDDKAVTLTRQLIRTDRFGGTLSGEFDIDLFIQDPGPMLDEFVPFGETEIEAFRDLLHRAEKLFQSTNETAGKFQGKSALDDYLNCRAQLIPYVDFLATDPLVCLVARPKALAAARAAIEAYENMLVHFHEHMHDLRKKSAEGSNRIFSVLLSLDLIKIEGQSEHAALIAPTSPLVLWKYVELADLLMSDTGRLSAQDVALLRSEMTHLPEPLTAVYVPFEDKEAAELGYINRIGSLPVYRPASVELTDVGQESLEVAARKLAALYPPVKKNLRVVLVNPVSTHSVSRSLKRLLADDFEQADVRAVRIGSKNALPLLEDSALTELHSEGKVTFSEVTLGSWERLGDRLEQSPAHLVLVSGERPKNIDLVEREGTRLHPLSFPHKLVADPLTDTVLLQPRAVQPSEDASRHPYGAYHTLVAALNGTPRVERTVTKGRQATMSDYKHVVGRCQYMLMSAAQEMRSEGSLLRLTQGVGLNGDAVFTTHKKRILTGFDQLLRGMNFNPSLDGLNNLLKRIEALGGEGVFSTITEKGDRGFSKSALRGQLGLAVALAWYQSNIVNNQSLILSLDNYLARQWLHHREDRKRTDLLGFRRDDQGQMHIDIIEVKSYDATAPEGHTAEPLQQLRAVEQVIHAMQTRQGEILVDRRRELLRLQMYREGLLHQEDVSADWVEMLNATIDGGAEPTVNLYWVDVLFDENIPIDVQDQVFESADGQRSLNAKHIRLGEGEIQRHLELIPRTRTIPPSPLVEEAVAPLAQAVDGHDDITADLVNQPDLPEKEQNSPLRIEATSADGSRHVDARERQEIDDMAKNIFRVLQDVGVKLAGEVNAEDADVGPSIIRYKLRLKPDQELSKFQRRSRDIMRELKATREPIIDNLPGTNFVYIDLPRTYPRPVSLLSVLTETHDKTRVNAIEVPFGITPEGTVVRLDLTELPHMLIGGSTGSGKTMFLYTMIAYVAQNYSPDQLQLILVDPKETDFVFFENLPHLHGSHVITDAEEAVERLQGLLDHDLNERTERLRSVAARDIRSYNSRPEVEPMRRILVVIDEFADLMDVMPTRAQKEAFEGSLRRLAQRARNVGIHLILATQRPTTDIVNGTIKTNLPCRVGFRLAATVDSQSILGQGGAEKLLGNGDMLVVKGGEVTRLQGFYISEAELVELIAGHGG